MNDVPALIDYGNALAAQGKLEQAQECFQKAVELNPHSVAAWLGLGQCQKQLKIFDKARSSFERALGVKPDHVSVLYCLAELLFDLGDYEEAQEFYEQALSQQPYSWKVLDGLGRTLGQKGKFIEALKCFDLATQLASENAVTWGNRGWALINLDQLSEAMDSLERAIALDSDVHFAWFNLGIVQRRLGLQEAATKNLERATRLIVDNMWPWIERGRCLECKGLYREAIACFERATQIAPDSYLPWLELGWTYLESELPDDAIKIFERCLNIDSGGSVAYIGLGHAFTRLGKIENAMENYSIGFWFDEAVDPSKNAFALWRMCRIFQENQHVGPLAYLVHQMTFALSQLSRREFGISYGELPQAYFIRYSERKDKGGHLGMVLAKEIPRIWRIFGIQRSMIWMQFIVKPKEAKKQVPETLYGDIAFFRAFFHEFIGHCFEPAIFNFINDPMEYMPEAIDTQRTPLNVESGLLNVFNLASKACSEGYALWFQFYGERILCQQKIIDTLVWQRERQKYSDLSKTNPYRIGLEVFEAIEVQMGELCAVAAYFVAFDIHHKLDLTVMDIGELKSVFKHSINNPNFRLLSLMDMPLPWDFRRNDAKRFIALAKVHLEQYCKNYPQCSVSGKIS